MATVANERDNDQLDKWTKPPFLRRVRIRGYKSIAFCDVALQPLTILVGRNGAGKSNFLDALAFLRDAMELNITEASKRHGGWHSILSRSSPEKEIVFEVEVSLSATSPPSPANPSPSLPSAEYGFVLKEGPPGSPVLIREWVRTGAAAYEGHPSFDLRGTYEPSQWNVKYDWQFHHPQVPCDKVPTPRPDRLWLGSFGDEPFQELADKVRLMGFYNFHPEAIRGLHKAGRGALLERDGSNLASVIEGLREIDPSAVERVRDYLALVTEEVTRFEVKSYDKVEDILFYLKSSPPASPVPFDAGGMSDGTLRALAALIATFQRHLPSGPTVVGIEEPETSLHPAALRALVDALDESTQRTQVLLTTHSADLLSGRDLTPGQVLVVRNRNGQTHITPVDPASRKIIDKELYSLADLHRMDRLDLDEADLKRQVAIGAGVNGG